MTIQQTLLSSGSVNWLNVLASNSSITPYGYQRIAIDASGNVYSAVCYDGTYQSIAVNKFDNLGNLVWTSTAVNTSTGQFYFGGIALDSSNNVYITGGRYTGTGNVPIILFKWNSSGTFQWGNLYGLINLNLVGTCLSIDSSNNVYISGYFTSGSTTTSTGYGFLLKANSSGTLLWTTGLSGANTSQPLTRLNSVSVDSSNNVYVVGTANDFTASNSYSTAILVKYNSSGTQQWQRRFYLVDSTRVSGLGYGLTIDSNNNIYIGGSLQGLSTTYGYIAKYNTSGTLQSYITPTTTYGSSFPLWNSLSCDVSGNIYAITDRGAVGAFTPSLSTLWANSFQQSSSYLNTASLVTSTSSNNIYVCGGSVVADVPNNGTKTGSYTVGSTSFVYSTNTIGSSSVTPTEEAASLITGTPSFTTTSYSTTTSFSPSVTVLYI